MESVVSSQHGKLISRNPSQLLTQKGNFDTLFAGVDRGSGSTGKPGVCYIAGSLFRSFKRFSYDYSAQCPRSDFFVART